MSTAWKNRKGYAQYRKSRAQILRDNEVHNGGRCTIQIDGVCTGKATETHHTLGIAATGNDLRYLVPTCRSCNLKIGKPKADPPSMPLGY